MAGKTRSPAVAIKQELLEKGRSFSFFQAIRLIRRFYTGNGNRPSGDGGGPIALKIRPNLSLSFPSSNVESIEESQDGTFTLTSNILGLYGTGSPLPTFYTEELMEDVNRGTTATKDFLDALNHRVYELLYDSWGKYRCMHTIVEQHNRRYTDMLFSISGLSESALKKEFDNPLELLRYSGLFCMKSRSASGLETLLSDTLGGLGVHIVQGIEKKSLLPDDQRCRLGMGVCLGSNSYMGSEYTERSGAFRIEIGPLSADEYSRFYPGTQAYNKLVALTRLYINSPAEFDIDIILDETERPDTVCLGGGKWAMLGLDTWVFSSEGPDEFRARLSPCDEKKAA